MKLARKFNFTEQGKVPEEISIQVVNIGKKYPNKEFEILLTNEKKRSSPQNRWLHGIAIPMITQFLRETKKDRGEEDYYKINEDSIKLWIKEKFLGYEEINGEKYLRRTSKLNTIQFMELKEALQIYWAPKGLNIPDPKEMETNN